LSRYIHKSHNVTVLLYHLVFPAKYRRAVIDAAVDQVSREVCLEIGTDEGGYQASIDRSSSIPRWSAKRARSAIEASTMRSARETTQVRRRKRASQCRWREWSRSMPWVSPLPTNSRPCGISSA